MLDAFGLDLRYAVRALWRRPVLAGAAILTLATGIAANTAVFSVIHTALYKPVPGVTRPERLVLISRLVGSEGTDVTFRMYRHLAARDAVLEGLAALSVQSVSVEGSRGPVARGSLAVAGDYFGLLGTHAARGRTFAPDETGGVTAPAVAVITHHLWQAEFGGDQAVVGRTTRINDVAVEILGVLPPGFAGHHTGLLMDVFVPLGLGLPGTTPPDELARGAGSLELLGRLRGSFTTRAAARALSGQSRPLRRERR